MRGLIICLQSDACYQHMQFPGVKFKHIGLFNDDWSLTYGGVRFNVKAKVKRFEIKENILGRPNNKTLEILVV